MKSPLLFLLYMCLLISIMRCKRSTHSEMKENRSGTVTCTNEYCEGFYFGEEFINGSYVAHQFSNDMSAKVGEQLKVLFRERKYVKVNFELIEMTTEGMESGEVNYRLKIPFQRIERECDAFTSFDHVGGWNHTPAIERRKKELQKLLISNESLDISSLMKTKEGLEEYWIQWKNKDVQSHCGV